MKLFYWACLFCCFLFAGCGKQTDELEDPDLMVQLEEEEEAREWSLPTDRSVAVGEVSEQEFPAYESYDEDVR